MRSVRLLVLETLHTGGGWVEALEYDWLVIVEGLAFGFGGDFIVVNNALIGSRSPLFFIAVIPHVPFHVRLLGRHDHLRLESLRVCEFFLSGLLKGSHFIVSVEILALID